MRAVVGVEPQRRQERAVGRARRDACAASTRLFAARIVGPRVERARERLLERRRRHRRVRNLVGQRERLPEREADRARQLQLGLLELVLGARSTRCRCVCSCTCARSTSMPATSPAVFRSCACLNSASAVSCCARVDLDAAAGGDRLEIQVHRDEHDQVARRLDAVLLGLLIAATRRARSFSAARSITGCDRYTRASNTLNGPTIGSGRRGSRRPRG